MASAHSDPPSGRDSGIDRSDYPHFEHKLRARWIELRDEIRDVLLRSDNEQYVQIGGQVRDYEDDSLADLLVDVNLAEVTRNVQQMRDIESALKRIALGTYGRCVDCGQPIERQRLEVYPTAKRCTRCQQIYEHDHATAPTPSL